MRLSFLGQTNKPLKITDWDALGYYIYLPAIFIYKDVKKLDWFPAIDQKYSMSGSRFYQAHKGENGNYVFFYLGGVAILQSPFFAIAHQIAPILGYEADGFSAPYQYAIAFGLLFYIALALLLLRHILLRFFEDKVVAMILLLMALASNFVQYTAVHAGMSHGWIFPLYVLVLYTTIKWHERPQFHWAMATGAIIGLATISRPTEAIMLFIPLLWNTNKPEKTKEKWNLVRQHYWQILATILAGTLAVLPQLLYWKYTSDSFVYSVGSKWFFLNPWWRVLFGIEKGWFIYTPITIFFVAGLFFIKKHPFRYSVLVFCLLNIWIIISWSDWRYGATYSCRALIQSYPIFALALGAFIQQLSRKWRWVLGIVGSYLILVNFIQIQQYNSGVLHINDMNWKYYAAIYLDTDPTPLDMSLLDTDEVFYPTADHQLEVVKTLETSQKVEFSNKQPFVLLNSLLLTQSDTVNWLKVTTTLELWNGYWDGFLKLKIKNGKAVKSRQFRLNNAISENKAANQYEFMMEIPKGWEEVELRLSLDGGSKGKGKLHDLEVVRIF